MRYEAQRNLERLRRDFKHIEGQLHTLVARLLAEEVSRYPVFVVSRRELSLGMRIARAEKTDLYWDVYITVLEELVKKDLLTEDKVVRFRQEYPDPLKKACFLVVPDNPQDAQFAFIPYANTSSGAEKPAQEEGMDGYGLSLN